MKPKASILEMLWEKDRGPKPAWTPEAPEEPWSPGMPVMTEMSAVPDAHVALESPGMYLEVHPTCLELSCESIAGVDVRGKQFRGGRAAWTRGFFHPDDDSSGLVGRLGSQGPAKSASNSSSSSFSGASMLRARCLLSRACSRAGMTPGQSSS